MYKIINVSTSYLKFNTELFSYFQLLEPQRKGTKRFLTLSEKVEVIELYNTNQNIRLLVNKFRCGISQIKSILRHQEKYLEDWKNQADPTRSKRGTSEQMKYHRLVMYEWLRRCQYYPVKLTDQYIRENAVRATKILTVTDFRINKEWIRRFKHKFKLNQEELLRNDTHYKKDKPQKSLNFEEIVNDKTFKIEDLDMETTKKTSSGNRYRIRKKSNELKKMSINIKQESSGLKDMDVFMKTTNSPSEENLTSVLNVVGKEIADYTEAVSFLQPLEDFALFKENVRAIGLINQLENLYRDEMLSMKAEEENLLTVLKKPESKDIKNFREAMIYLWPLEQFSLAKENVRAVALINLLENIFRQEMLKAAKS